MTRPRLAERRGRSCAGSAGQRARDGLRLVGRGASIEYDAAISLGWTEAGAATGCRGDMERGGGGGGSGRRSHSHQPLLAVPLSGLDRRHPWGPAVHLGSGSGQPTGTWLELEGTTRYQSPTGVQRPPDGMRGRECGRRKNNGAGAQTAPGKSQVAILHDSAR